MEDGGLENKEYDAQKEKFKNIDLFIEIAIIAGTLIARILKERKKQKDKQ